MQHNFNRPNKCYIIEYFTSFGQKSLKKQQYVVTHTIRQTEVPACQASNTPSVKIFYPQKNTSYIFAKKKTDVLKCSPIKNLSSFCVSCKSVYWWVTINRYFISDMINKMTLASTDSICEC
jgi:hypothetical protein